MKIKFKQILPSFLIFLTFLFLCSCKPDIRDDKAVTENMQGTWVGYDHDNGIYTHYKLQISGNKFKGWLKTANTDDEPTWSDQPDETGTFTLSPVQGYTNLSGKYRNINFYKEGGGFGDNSLIAQTFTEMIIFDDGSGLYVSRWAAMTEK
jgi:hypothetical protein